MGTARLKLERYKKKENQQASYFFIYSLSQVFDDINLINGNSRIKYKTKQRGGAHIIAPKVTFRFNLLMPGGNKKVTHT